MRRRMALRLRSLAAFILLAAAAGCAGLPFLSGATPTPSATPSPPTATPPPLAARVNGEGILQADWEAEVRLFEAAQASRGIDLATLPDYRTQVLQALVDRLLLAQAARAAGPPLSDEELDARLDSLASARGGNEAMGVWLAENGYTVESFKRSLEMDVWSARQVAALSSAVSDQAEQVHAAHILVATREEADALQADLAAGADFAMLAETYSLDGSTRPAGGDLGWFPQGYLLVPEVDAAAWSLAPGETSDVIQSSLGYHIVRVIERGVQPLAPAARLEVQHDAVETWLQSRRAEAQVEILVSP